MMETIYTPDHEVFRQAVRRFLRAEIGPHVDEWEKARGVPREVWRKFGEQGFLCPWVEEKYGGSGAGLEYSVIITEEMGHVRATAPMVPLHSDIIVPYIADFGTDEQKSRWLPGCVTGDIVTAIAMTEPGTGSDLQAIATKAVLEGGEWVISGAKTFISNGLCSDLVIVVCRTDPDAPPAHGGLSLIAVESGTPGFERGRKLDKMGNHAQDTAELFFDGCRVPAANVIGKPGSAFRLLMEKLQQERVMTALISQVMAEVILEVTVEYCRTRKAFGQPIAQFQHSAFKLAEIATEIEIGRAFIERVLVDHIRGKRVPKQASMAKYWICEMVNRVAYDCVQLHGGYGFMEDYPVCRMYRDVRCHTIWAGTTEIMKTIIARSMGL